MLGFFAHNLSHFKTTPHFPQFFLGECTEAVLLQDSRKCFVDLKKFI